MGLSDLDKLKKLSWYTNPFLCLYLAWIIHDNAYLEPEFLTLQCGLVTIFGEIRISQTYWLLRFTSEFGMESGGSKSLWSPSKFFKFGKLFVIIKYTFKHIQAFGLLFESIKTLWVLYG